MHGVCKGAEYRGGTPGIWFLLVNGSVGRAVERERPDPGGLLRSATLGSGVEKVSAPALQKILMASNTKSEIPCSSGLRSSVKSLLTLMLWRCLNRCG